MSHFSSTDGSCKHGIDGVGKEERRSEGGEGEEEGKDSEDDTCFAGERDEAGLLDREGKPALSSDVLFAVTESR
jgi:hypothetical protein